MTAKVLLQDKINPGKGLLTGVGDATGFTQRRSFQASVEGVGSTPVTAVVRIYGCNDGRYPIQIVQFDLSGNGVASDADADDFPWEYYVAELVSVSAGARVSVVASV